MMRTVLGTLKIIIGPSSRKVLGSESPEPEEIRSVGRS